MKRKKDTLARYICLEELHEMEELIPMTLLERNKVRQWVYSGHSVSENPWRYHDEEGYELNYLDAYHHHLAQKWGDFYRPFYQVVRTDGKPQAVCPGGFYDEEPFC